MVVVTAEATAFAAPGAAELLLVAGEPAVAAEAAVVSAWVVLELFRPIDQPQQRWRAAKGTRSKRQRIRDTNRVSVLACAN